MEYVLGGQQVVEELARDQDVSVSGPCLGHPGTVTHIWGMQQVGQVFICICKLGVCQVQIKKFSQVTLLASSKV